MSVIAKSYIVERLVASSWFSSFFHRKYFVSMLSQFAFVTHRYSISVIIIIYLGGIFCWFSSFFHRKCFLSMLSQFAFVTRRYSISLIIIIYLGGIFCWFSSFFHRKYFMCMLSQFAFVTHMYSISVIIIIYLDGIFFQLCWIINNEMKKIWNYFIWKSWRNL